MTQPRRLARGPVDAHGTPLRELEFLPDAAERRAFVGRILAILERKGFVGRAEYFGRRRVDVFALPAMTTGFERCAAIIVGTDGWAYSLSGAPVTPSDLAELLIRHCRTRARK